MRALVLLLLVGVSFLLVVKLYPASPVEGEEDTRPGPEQPEQPEQGAGFLTRPEGAGPAPAPRPASAQPEATPAVAAAPETAFPTAGDEIPSWLENVEPPAPRSSGELPLAAALVHGGAADVRAAVRANDDLPAGRSAMAEAFALALDGDARAGLELATGLDEGQLTGREKELLQAALGGEPADVRPIEAGVAESPLVLAMEMRLAARDGAELLAQRRHPEAARTFSDLLLAELDAPWAADQDQLRRWTQALDDAQRHHRWHPKGDWPGVEMVVEPGDSPVAIRKRFLAQNPGYVMSAGLLLEANAVRGYLQPGQRLRIPTEPVRMLVDLSARWSLMLIGDEVVGSWPVGIGREGEETPTGEYVAGNKLEEPTWMRVGQEPVPYGDAGNPLGTRWIGWFVDGVKTSYGFHGTWEPETVGTPSSDGCIRLHNEDVERLFEILPLGSAILVRD